MSAEDVTEGEEFKVIYSVLKNNVMKIHKLSEDAISFLDDSLNPGGKKVFSRTVFLSGVLLSLSTIENCLNEANEVIEPFAKQIRGNAEKNSNWRTFLKKFFR